MEAISPQRILEEAVRLLETLRDEPGLEEELDERIGNNIEELQDLAKRLYMQGLYSV